MGCEVSVPSESSLEQLERSWSSYDSTTTVMSDAESGRFPPPALDERHE